MLTDDVDAFTDALQPGDVLLFDKGLRASSIIAFTDLRPVSHAAVVVEGGRDAAIVDATHPPAVRETGRLQAVERTPLRAMFGLRHADARGTVNAVRTLTARRSVVAAADGTGDAIAARALAWCDEQAHFAWRDLGSLAPYAFVRASDSPNAATFLPVLHSLVQLVRRGLGVVDPESSGPAVTCSELVYRCLAGALPDGSLAPAIAAPLVRDGKLRIDWPAMSGDGMRDGTGEMAAMASELDALRDDVALHLHPDRADTDEGRDPMLADEVMGTATRGLLAGARGDGAFSPGDIVAWASNVVDAVRRPPALELADGVTPGDLLDSSSLTTVAVLHLRR